MGNIFMLVAVAASPYRNATDCDSEEEIEALFKEMEQRKMISTIKNRSGAASAAFRVEW
jgi:hypothetical protein